MLISTHLIADVESIIDSAVFLKDGRLLLAGDADDLRIGLGQDPAAERAPTRSAEARSEYSARRPTCQNITSTTLVV